MFKKMALTLAVIATLATLGSIVAHRLTNEEEVSEEIVRPINVEEPDV